MNATPRLPIMIIMVLCLLAGACPAAGDSQPGGTLAFSALRNCRWSIWRCRADGAELKQLTDGEMDSDPRWSPDGKRLVFTRFREGRPEVCLVAAEGGGVEQVCEGQQASWTADGQGLLFCRDGQVLSRELASGREKRITPEMWEQCAFPVMSPDGKKVACSSRHEKVIGIYIIDLADGKAARLATSKEACTPRWSPDGGRILFQTSTHVCAIGSDGKDEEDLTFGGGIQHQGQFSPDGKWIVFTRGNGADGPWSLCLLNLADGQERPSPIKDQVRYPDWRKE